MRVVEVILFIFLLYLLRGNVGYNCCKFVVILSSSLLAVKSLLVGDV